MVSASGYEPAKSVMLAKTALGHRAAWREPQLNAAKVVRHADCSVMVVRE